MSSTTPDKSTLGRAEKKFRDAFDRLKAGKPDLLAKGTPVSQNNVAREAGVDPSALRRSRFPTLVAEIQLWIASNGDASEGESPSLVALARRRRNRTYREQNDDLRAQRDDALAKLVDAEATIVNLVIENEQLRAKLPSKVAPLRPALRRPTVEPSE